jgi:hypothetical protein
MLGADMSRDLTIEGGTVWNAEDGQVSRVVMNRSMTTHRLATETAVLG